MLRLKQPRPISPVILAAACAILLVGCTPEYGDYDYAMPHTSAAAARRSASTAPKIPLPDRALLTAQGEPDCDSQGGQQRADKDRPRLAAGRTEGATAGLVVPTLPEGGQADPNADLALRIKLEYERECYRQAEARMRERLKQLQASTTQTVKAVKGADQGAR